MLEVVEGALVVAEAQLEQVVLAVAEMAVHQVFPEAMVLVTLAAEVAVAVELCHLVLAATAALAL